MIPPPPETPPSSERPPRWQLVFAELKRRKVFKVAAVYGATAFVVLQAAELLAEGLALPPALLRSVTALLLLFFPVALVLAWAYETTPHGVRRTDPARTGELEAIVAEPRSRRWRSGLLALAGTALLLAGLWTVGGPQLAALMGRGARAGEAAGRRPAGGTPSVAVLPFVDMSPEGDQAYFADGVAEEILNVLARIDGLHVAARTSSFKLRDEDVATVGARLGVSSVLEGSVRKQGNQVRVTAQLIDVADGFHVWSQRFERSLTDIFAVQDEIARAIAGALRVELTGGKEAAFARWGTGDIDAYNAYLLGRYHWNRRSPDALRNAAKAFQKAIDLDPDYAAAYAGLADTYSIMAGYAYEPPAGMFPKAKAATLEALRLDPDLAAGHRSLAFVEHAWEWNWEAAERSYLKALELAPDDGFAHYWYSLLLTDVGRYEEAEAEILRARQLDPLAPQIGTGVGQYYLSVREFDRAAEALREVLEIEPDFLGARAMLGIARLARGRYAEVLEETAAYEGLHWGYVLNRVRALWGLGRRDEARALADRAGAEADSVYWDPVLLAAVYASVDDGEEALRQLERGYRERATTFVSGGFFRWVFDPLRVDPRYRAILRRVGLAVPPDAP